MMSLLQELLGDHLEAVIGFGQVFLASGMVVAVGYWARVRLFGSPPPKPKRRRAQKNERSSKRLPKPDQKPSASIAADVVQLPAAPEPLTVAPKLAAGWANSLEFHSQRVATFVRQAAARGEAANELHERARVRLEAADYTFQRLVLDLASIISVPQKPETVMLEEVVASVPEHRLSLAA